MALFAQHNERKFGVGDIVRVHQKIGERIQVFEGTVIKIKGSGNAKSFTVRRIGGQGVGVEQIIPLTSPNMEKVDVVEEGTPGVRRGKLYYIRDKSKRQIDKIYARSKRRTLAKRSAKK